MKLNTLLMITAVVAFIFGLGFILAPVWTIGLYGNTLEGVGIFVARYFGAALLGYAFLAWLTRNTASKGVQAGFFAAMVLGFVVALYDAFAGTHNALIWLNVAIYLLLAIGFGYFAFMKKD
ncbi:MAG: hypothetical protein A2Z71_07805 [Chloroflexi bacterium RBG_13_50_21]|nr:MAG: hypothetical protein A2Z71_07805 [Chloroflexi bacterium RBG_13_50_21]